MHSSSSSSFICSSFSFRPSRPTLAFTSQRGRLPERTIGTTIKSRRAVMGPSSSAVPRASKSSLGTPLSQMLPECVYLDYNATTPIFPEVAEEMMPFLETLRQPFIDSRLRETVLRGDSFEQRESETRDWCKKWPKRGIVYQLRHGKR